MLMVQIMLLVEEELNRFLEELNTIIKKNTYFLLQCVRMGNSNFAPDKRWGYFPSVSAGWVITKEDFMSSTSSVLNFAKLRGSWGQNGNQVDRCFPIFSQY